jgi:hypothetical protein
VADHAGRPIRDDVRIAALEMWPRACARARAVLRDVADAAGLLESAVEQISRYLDRLGASPFSENTAGLLTVAFCRTLGRHAAKLRRLETLGSAVEFAQLMSTSDLIGLVELRLDVDKIVRQLSYHGCTIVALKSAGYEWKYIAHLVGTTVSVAKTGFWREVRRARLRVEKGQSTLGSGGP